VHGGLIMSLTDTLGSLAVASQGQYMTGVSTDISTSFVKPAGKPGDELKMTATLTAMGMFIKFQLLNFLAVITTLTFLYLFIREIASVHSDRLH
jgi:acyl-coenzyme A thioesterase 13